MPLLCFASCILDQLFNVLGYKRKFIELLEDWILSRGLKHKLVDLGRE